MSEDDLTELRALAADGDSDAVAQLVELAGERGDVDELRRLAAAGSEDAIAVLVEVAGEQGNVEEPTAQLRAACCSRSADRSAGESGHRMRTRGNR